MPFTELDVQDWIEETSANDPKFKDLWERFQPDRERLGEEISRQKQLPAFDVTGWEKAAKFSNPDFREVWDSYRDEVRESFENKKNQ